MENDQSKDLKIRITHFIYLAAMIDAAALAGI
jgi:hypothetical protein